MVFIQGKAGHGSLSQEVMNQLCAIILKHGILMAVKRCSYKGQLMECRTFMKSLVFMSLVVDDIIIVRQFFISLSSNSLTHSCCACSFDSRKLATHRRVSSKAHGGTCLETLLVLRERKHR